MKIVGFPIDVSRSQDGRIVRGLRTRQALIQATLDLIQAGDVEPTSAAIATIAGVSSRALFQHFTSLADLYAAAFDLAVSRAFDRNRPVDAAAPLSNRIELLVSDRAQLFEEWLPVWHFAERVRSVARQSRSRLARPGARLARPRLRSRQLDEHARAASPVAGPRLADLALHRRGHRPAGAHSSQPARGGGLTSHQDEAHPSHTQGFVFTPPQSRG